MFKSGYRLRVSVTSIIAIVVAIFLTFFAKAPDFPSNDGHPPSWSQNAPYGLWSVLNVLLLAIAYVWGELASHFEGKEKPVHKWMGKEVRFEHFARGCQYGFYAILIFHLGSSIFPEMLHMVATATGIGYMGLLVLGWFDMWSKWWWVFTGALIFSVSLLLCGFVLKLTEVGYGEFALLVVGVGFIFLILKSK